MSTPGIGQLREEIQQLDRMLVKLIVERVGLARRVGELKRDAGRETLNPAREAEVVRHAAGLARDAGLEDEKVRSIFWQIVGLCRHVQREESRSAPAADRREDR